MAVVAVQVVLAQRTVQAGLRAGFAAGEAALKKK